jgi:hypothetical protein
MHPVHVEPLDSLALCPLLLLLLLLLLLQMVYEGIPYLPLSWRDKQLKASAEAAKVGDSSSSQSAFFPVGTAHIISRSCRCGQHMQQQQHEAAAAAAAAAPR